MDGVEAWWKSAVEEWWAEAPLEEWQYAEQDLRWFDDHGAWGVERLLSRIDRGEVSPRRSKEEQRAQIERDAKNAARRAKRAKASAE